MSDPVDARLRRVLGGERFAALRGRLRRRFERAPMGGGVDYVHLGSLGAEEHAALASLLGRSQRYSRSLRVDVRLIDETLRRSGIAACLRDALEQLDGPIVALDETRLRLQTLWSSVIDGCDHPGLAGVLRAPAGIGLLKRLARQDAVVATRLCRRAQDVLRHLPANGVTRSQLAADVLGDAHALDDGRATAALVLAALRLAAPGVADDGGVPAEAPAEDRGPRPTPDAERARDVWSRAGVLVNELARPALFLNLPTREAGSGRWPMGDPAYASLRSLLRSPPRWDAAGRTVHVCENPNLVAIAADRWGAGCAPLACTDGMPAAAQRCLLSQLARAGARLCYHGDFDWPGLHIGNHVMREHGAEPWRFGAPDYLAAVRTSARSTQPLAGKAVETSWDGGALSAAMRDHRVAIAEEALAASLLGDLGDGVASPTPASRGSPLE